MKAVMKGVGSFLVLMVALGTTLPSFAQVSERSPSASEEAGSVIVFPKFIKGTATVDGVTKPRTEIEVRARCPSGASCPAAEPLKIRMHWVCPGSANNTPKYVCKESDFDVTLSVDGKAELNPEDPKLRENDVGSIAPCPSGYLIGWVISPATERPIKYDGLTGSAIFRDARGAIESYQAFAIRADPNLATRAEIATDIDPRTGTPALVFDGGAGHYQAVAAAIPEELEYHQLIGPLSSGEAFLILLTLDIRANRPNYPIIFDLDFRSDQGGRTSASRSFICWTEIQNPNIDTRFTLAGARTRDAVVISGQAIKVPVPSGGISDIPGPVTLMGLVPTDAGRSRSMDQAYILKQLGGTKPKTVFVPF